MEDRYDNWEPLFEIERANARLIAAAPDLLERAKALLANWENGNISGYVQSLAKTVAKAEGED